MQLLLYFTFTLSVALVLPSQISGALQYKFHGEFERVWADGGSGATLSGSFWRPTNVPDGYFILGHSAMSGHNLDRSSYALIIKSDSEDDVKAPQSLSWVYDSVETGVASHVTILQPIAPEGYVCLGMLAYSDLLTPELDQFPTLRCVRQELVTSGSVGRMYWSDRQSGGKHDFSSWQINSANAIQGISVGSFFGHRSYNRPLDSLQFALKKSALGKETDFLTQVSQLLAFHAPNLYFHPSEQFHPDSAEAVFNQSTFYYGNVDQSYDNFKREIKGAITNFGESGNVQNLINQANGMKYWLGIPDKLHPGNLTRARVCMGSVARTSTLVDFIFYTFFPYNGAGKYRAALGGVGLQSGRLKYSGSHQGDWEQFTIRMQKPLFQHDPVKVVDYYLSVHNGGSWIGTSLESDSDGRPVIYSSMFTHAMYANAGEQRYCRPRTINAGIANFFIELIDETGRGAMIKTSDWSKLQLVTPNIFPVAQPTPDWFEFNGPWGDYYRNTETISTVLGIEAYTFKEVSSGTGPLKGRRVWTTSEIDEAVECDG